MPYRVRGESKVVEVGKLYPNDWNPNKMDERAYEAARESIEEHGFVDELLSRPHPQFEGCYEIIDGEHRQRLITEIAADSPEILVPIRVIDADDAEARKLTIIMNETRGSADKVDLAKLLAELEDDYGEDLGKGLPYSDSELQELVSLASHAWDDYGSEWGDGDDEDQADGGEWVTIEVRMTTEDYEAFVDAKNKVAGTAPLTGDVPTQNGQVVAALAAEYLGSVPTEGAA